MARGFFKKMLRVTKAKHRLFEESRHWDQLLRGLQLQILHSKASRYCNEVDFRECEEPQPSNGGSFDFLPAPSNEGATAAESCPPSPQQVPVDGSAQQNGNMEAVPTLDIFFPSTHSQERSHQESDNNQSTPQFQGYAACQESGTQVDEIELHINDEDWNEVMGLLDCLD